MAAGEGLLGSVRMFLTYREALFWKMNGGLGDVVFAPLYEELKRRGVRFHFFHRLENVGLVVGERLSVGDTPHVCELSFAVQATTKDRAEYEPLVDIDGSRCWPAEPDWNQLEGGAEMRHSGHDFESFWDCAKTEELKISVGKDFDFVVLGISVGAIPATCRELIEDNERWRAMVKEVKTVATQSLQLWMSEDLRTLGWRDVPPSLSAFVTPFDTWADMTHLARIENPGHPAKTIAYFCSVLDTVDPSEHVGEHFARYANELVRDNAVGFLNNSIGHLWPHAVDEYGFKWSLLTSPGSLSDMSTSDSSRLESQYWRANVNPSDRYVLSLPGSIRYRISPLDKTYDNLTICGDWTDCGFNLGCIEAAVMSGRLASHALSLYPRLEDIDGYDFP
jgi:uncharacterized protein with NAD-binding domain and iron-sulfur cluster